MSATMREIRFIVTVRDPERWDIADFNEADFAPDDSYDDFAARKIEEAMREAGNAYIREHRSMYLDPLA